MGEQEPGHNLDPPELDDERSLGRDSHDDWLLRFCDARSVTLATVGGAVVVLYFLVLIGFHSLTGTLQGVTASDLVPGMSGIWQGILRGEAVDALLIGFLAVAPSYLRRGSVRGLQELRPSLRCSEGEFSRLVERVGTLPTRYLAASIVFGALIGFTLTRFDPGIWAEGVRPPMSHPAFWWNALQNSLMASLIGRFGMSELVTSMVHYDAGKNLVEVDLLDRRGLAPFGRKGQRSVVLWIILSSIFSLFWLSPSAGELNLLWFLWFLSIAGAAFFGSVYGVHLTIRTARKTELDRVRPEIRQAIEGRRAAGKEDASLANLLAYRSLVDGVSEWPFDLSTLLRTGLVIALGVGSWLGAALMERLLSLVLQ